METSDHQFYFREDNSSNACESCSNTMDGAPELQKEEMKLNT